MNTSRKAAAAAAATIVVSVPAVSPPSTATADYVGRCYGACWQYASAISDIVFEWSVNLVGYCGYQSGGIVKGDQALLWAAGMLGQPSGSKNKVDGLHGPQTNNAISAYQWWHGITNDGCAGHYTHYNMQADLHIIRIDARGVLAEFYDPVAAFVWGEQPRVRVFRDSTSPIPYSGPDCWWFDWYGARTWSAPGYPEQLCSYWFADDLGFLLYNSTPHPGIF